MVLNICLQSGRREKSRTTSPGSSRESTPDQTVPEPTRVKRYRSRSRSREHTPIRQQYVTLSDSTVDIRQLDSTLRLCQGYESDTFCPESELEIGSKTKIAIWIQVFLCILLVVILAILYIRNYGVFRQSTS